jgi:hypothetical protein
MGVGRLLGNSKAPFQGFRGMVAVWDLVWRISIRVLVTGSLPTGGIVHPSAGMVRASLAILNRLLGLQSAVRSAASFQNPELPRVDVVEVDSL